jgi:MFS family permease
MAAVPQQSTSSDSLAVPPSSKGPAHASTRKVPDHLKRLYTATVLFGIGCGVSLGLTPLYLNALGFTKQNIGTLSLFFAGALVLFSLPVGMLIRRFSAERILAICLFGYALSLVGFPHMKTYESIAFVRVFDGLGTIGVWVASETVLLAQAQKAYKAYLTTLYAIALALGYVIGPFLARGMAFVTTDPRISFSVGAFSAISAGVFVLLKMPPTPPAEGVSSDEPVASTPSAPAHTPAMSIFWKIKTSCLAAFSYGYFQAAVVLFLPLYLIDDKGWAPEHTIILPGLFCLGMLLCSNIVGRIADRVGHLKTVRALSSVGLMAILGFVVLDNYWVMCFAVFIAGATFASMSPVALALTGVVTKAQDYSRANAIYNLFYATGILLGPPVASVIYTNYGGKRMIEHIAILWVAFVIFTIVFIHDDPASRRAKHLPANAPS